METPTESPPRTFSSRLPSRGQEARPRPPRRVVLTQEQVPRQEAYLWEIAVLTQEHLHRHASAGGTTGEALAQGLSRSAFIPALSLSDANHVVIDDVETFSQTAGLSGVIFALLEVLLNSCVKKVNPYHVHNAKFICIDHHE